ncbi:MAG: hypothetical protein RL563_2685 [Pseudomonadota bacterium]|jgi:hypothetical protein
MRVDLKVPYSEKDRAKQLGAKWDAAAKTWYVIGVDDLWPFLKWIPKHLAKPCRQAVEAKTETVKQSLKKPRQVKSNKAYEKAMKRLAEKNADYIEGLVTPRTDFSLPDTGCSCPSWDECEHVLLARCEIADEQLNHIRSIINRA